VEEAGCDAGTMSFSKLGLVTLAASFLLVLGCGNVTVETSSGATTGETTSGSSNDTSGSGSSSSSSAGSGGAGGNPTSGTAAGGADASCETFCGPKESPWCGAGPDCLESCKKAVAGAGSCADALAAALACYNSKAEATNCWLDEECQQKIKQYGECIAPGECGTAACSGADNDCGCQVTCGGSQLETSCSYYDLGWDCHCTINGLSLGKCGGGNADACDPLGGCCKDYF
jgi:hypothetical protein